MNLPFGASNMSIWIIDACSCFSANIITALKTQIQAVEQAVEQAC